MVKAFFPAFSAEEVEPMGNALRPDGLGGKGGGDVGDCTTGEFFFPVRACKVDDARCKVSCLAALCCRNGT